MTYETIRLETNQRGISRLTMIRADKHNAMNATMIRELAAAAKSLAGDGQVRAVILGSEGKSFSAGADLTWMREQLAKDRQGRIEEASVLARMLRSLDDLPQPLIARVQGPAYGGGVGLMAVSDIVVASADAKFALSETRLGLIPATIGALRYPPHRRGLCPADLPQCQAVRCHNRASLRARERGGGAGCAGCGGRGRGRGGSAVRAGGRGPCQGLGEAPGPQPRRQPGRLLHRATRRPLGERGGEGGDRGVPGAAIRAVDVGWR